MSLFLFFCCLCCLAYEQCILNMSMNAICLNNRKHAVRLHYLLIHPHKGSQLRSEPLWFTSPLKRNTEIYELKPFEPGSSHFFIIVFLDKCIIIDISIRKTVSFFFLKCIHIDACMIKIWSVSFFTLFLYKYIR